MTEAPDEVIKDPSNAEILLILEDLAEVIDILHTEISEMKKILKIIRTDVTDIKGTEHTKAQSYMHG